MAEKCRICGALFESIGWACPCCLPNRKMNFKTGQGVPTNPAELQLELMKAVVENKALREKVAARDNALRAFVELHRPTMRGRLYVDETQFKAAVATAKALLSPVKKEGE